MTIRDYTKRSYRKFAIKGWLTRLRPSPFDLPHADSFAPYSASTAPQTPRWRLPAAGACAVQPLPGTRCAAPLGAIRPRTY
jgi:hypothetical protein